MQAIYIWPITDIDKQVGHDNGKWIVQNELPSGTDTWLQFTQLSDHKWKWVSILLDSGH